MRGMRMKKLCSLLLALVLAVIFYQRVSARKDSGPAVTA